MLSWRVFLSLCGGAWGSPAQWGVRPCIRVYAVLEWAAVAPARAGVRRAFLLMERPPSNAGRLPPNGAPRPPLRFLCRRRRSRDNGRLGVAGPCVAPGSFEKTALPLAFPVSPSPLYLLPFPVSPSTPLPTSPLSLSPSLSLPLPTPPPHPCTFPPTGNRPIVHP